MQKHLPLHSNFAEQTAKTIYCTSEELFAGVSINKTTIPEVSSTNILGFNVYPSSDTIASATSVYKPGMLWRSSTVSSGGSRKKKLKSKNKTRKIKQEK